MGLPAVFSVTVRCRLPLCLSQHRPALPCFSLGTCLQMLNCAAVQGTDEGAMDYGLNRALDAYYNDRAWFHGLQKRVMEQVRFLGRCMLLP